MTRYAFSRKISNILVIFSFLLSACQHPELIDAKDGVAQAVNELPQFDEVAHLKTIEEHWVMGYHEFFDWIKEVETPCYYGRVYQIFGTSLPFSDMLDLYTQPLQKLGWQLESEYPSGLSFKRGFHEWLEMARLADTTHSFQGKNTNSSVNNTQPFS